MNTRASRTIVGLTLLLTACGSEEKAQGNHGGSAGTAGMAGSSGMAGTGGSAGDPGSAGASGCQPSSTFGTAWSPVGAEPTLSLDPCPTWNCLGTADPALVEQPEGTFHIWFTTGGDLGGPAIGHMTAGTNLDFQLVPNEPVSISDGSGRWDLHRETPSVVWDEASGRWHMWYLGYSVSFFDDPAIGHATSSDPDGLAWDWPDEPIYRPEPGAWDFAFLTGPTGLRGPDGTWRVYFTGAGTTVGIGLLTSQDAIHFTPHEANPVFERDFDGWDQGIFEPSVIHMGSEYWMFYAGYLEPLDVKTSPIAIGLATSEDGVAWTRRGDGPVLNPGPPGSWNSLKVLSPSVIRRSDCSLWLAAYGGSLDTKDTVPFGHVGIWKSE
jgi:hypothetical protein